MSIPKPVNTGSNAPCEPSKRPEVLRGEPKGEVLLTGFTCFDLLSGLLLIV